MSQAISQRLSDIIDALPLKAGMRVLEIGSGPGVAARAIVNKIEGVYVLAIDRSAKAIDQAKKSSVKEMESGRLRYVQSSIEEFSLPDGEELFDLAFAIRVGALDGRHPELEKKAFKNIANALKEEGKLFIDGGNPIKEISLKNVGN